MIIEKIFYGIQCDNCKVIDEAYEGVSFWSDIEASTDIAAEGDWHIDDKKHYCPKCHYFDDDDNLVVVASRAKPETK